MKRAGRRGRGLVRMDRAFLMLERAGCFLCTGQETSREDTRAVYARVLMAQRAIARAMRDLAPDHTGLWSG